MPGDLIQHIQDYEDGIPSTSQDVFCTNVAELCVGYVCNQHPFLIFVAYIDIAVSSDKRALSNNVDLDYAMG